MRARGRKVRPVVAVQVGDRERKQAPRFVVMPRLEAAVAAAEKDGDGVGTPDGIAARGPAHELGPAVSVQVDGLEVRKRRIYAAARGCVVAPGLERPIAPVEEHGDRVRAADHEVGLVVTVQVRGLECTGAGGDRVVVPRLEAAVSSVEEHGDRVRSPADKIGRAVAVQVGGSGCD